MLSKSEVSEIQEQISQMIDMVVVTGEEFYTKLSEHPEVFTALAKCLMTMIKELEEAGFSRNESIAIATNYLNSLNLKK